MHESVLNTFNSNSLKTVSEKTVFIIQDW